MKNTDVFLRWALTGEFTACVEASQSECYGKVRHSIPTRHLTVIKNKYSGLCPVPPVHSTWAMNLHHRNSSLVQSLGDPCFLEMCKNSKKRNWIRWSRIYDGMLTKSGKIFPWSRNTSILGGYSDEVAYTVMACWLTEEWFPVPLLIETIMCLGSKTNRG